MLYIYVESIPLQRQHMGLDTKLKYLFFCHMLYYFTHKPTKPKVSSYTPVFVLLCR